MKGTEMKFIIPLKDKKEVDFLITRLGLQLTTGDFYRKAITSGIEEARDAISRDMDKILADHPKGLTKEEITEQYLIKRVYGESIDIEEVIEKNSCGFEESCNYLANLLDRKPGITHRGKKYFASK